METKGLIYKVQDYKETSKLLFVYTPKGKYTLVAKGAKNYKSAYMSYDYLTLIKFDLNETKSIQTLKDTEIEDYFPSIKSDYTNILNASLILKAIELLTDDLPHERLFNLIIWLLSFKDLSLATITLYVKLTYALGYELSFDKEYEGFDLTLGCTVNHVKSLNKEETTALKALYYLKEEIILDEVLKKTLKQFIKKYYIYHMDYDIKF